MTTKSDIENKLVDLGFSKKLANNTAMRLFYDSEALHEALCILTDEQINIIAEHYPDALALADWHGKILGGRRFDYYSLQLAQARATFETAQADI